MENFDEKNTEMAAELVGSRHCAAAFFLVLASTEVVHRPCSDMPLHFDVKEYRANSQRKIKC